MSVFHNSFFSAPCMGDKDVCVHWHTPANELISPYYLAKACKVYAIYLQEVGPGEI